MRSSDFERLGELGLALAGVVKAPKGLKGSAWVRECVGSIQT